MLSIKKVIMKRFISLLFWILITFWGIWIIFISNPNYVSLSEIKCEQRWKEWDRKKRICSNNNYVDEIDKKINKSLIETSEKFGININYPQLWVEELDNILKESVLKISRDFKIKISKGDKKVKKQLIINFKEYEKKNKDINIVSIIYDIYDESLKRKNKKYYQTFVYDINKWKLLSFENLFKKDWEVLKKFNFLVKERLKNKINYDYINVVKEEKNIETYKNFYIEKDMFIILYPLYKEDIYNYQYKEVKIPLINIIDILNENIS